MADFSPFIFCSGLKPRIWQEFNRATGSNSSRPDVDSPNYTTAERAGLSRNEADQGLPKLD
jgi:hypothetical protein